MRLIDADLFANNVKTWAENIRDFRSDNKCFFTEENILLESWGEIMNGNNLSDYSREQIEKNLKTVLTLEWLGVHIEDTKEITDEYGIPSKTVYYLSVPETSTIEVEDKELNKKIQSSDNLIALAKKEILDMLMDSCKDVFGDDEEFLEEVKNNTSDYFKFYAKVRKGEIWTKELGDAMVKKLTDEIHAASAYKEV